MYFCSPCCQYTQALWININAISTHRDSNKLSLCTKYTDADVSSCTLYAVFLHQHHNNNEKKNPVHLLVLHHMKLVHKIQQILSHVEGGEHYW